MRGLGVVGRSTGTQGDTSPRVMRCAQPPPLMRLSLLLVALLFSADALAQAWTLRLDEGLTDSAYDVVALPDGGFVAVGYTSGPTPSLDAFAVRTDASGAVLWTRRVARGAYSERA